VTIIIIQLGLWIGDKMANMFEFEEVKNRGLSNVEFGGITEELEKKKKTKICPKCKHEF